MWRSMQTELSSNFSMINTEAFELAVKELKENGKGFVKSAQEITK